MKLIFLGLLLVNVSGCGFTSGLLPTKSVEKNATCVYDRKLLLGQDLETFDQSATGVRSLYTRSPECKLEAAQLIADYRALNPEAQKEFNAYLLYWHEGQLRAEVGDYQKALPLLEHARMSADAGPEVSLIWNLYVDATKAFVMRDKKELSRAREKLASVPPQYHSRSGKPPNLNVVDGLLLCFDRTYSDAYRNCRTK